MNKQEAYKALEEVAFAIRKDPTQSNEFNIRRHQQGDPEFCIEVGFHLGAQLNKHHLRAMLALIEEAEQAEGGDQPRTVSLTVPDNHIEFPLFRAAMQLAVGVRQGHSKESLLQYVKTLEQELEPIANNS